MKTNSLKFGKQPTVMVVFKFVPKTSILKISSFWVLGFAFKTLLKVQHRCNSGSEGVPGAEGADIQQWYFILPPIPKHALQSAAALPGPGNVPVLERALTAGLHLERLFRCPDRSLWWGENPVHSCVVHTEPPQAPPLYGWAHPWQLSYTDPLCVLCPAASTEGN